MISVLRITVYLKFKSFFYATAFIINITIFILIFLLEKPQLIKYEIIVIPASTVLLHLYRRQKFTAEGRTEKCCWCNCECNPISKPINKSHNPTTSARVRIEREAPAVVVAQAGMEGPSMAPPMATHRPYNHNRAPA